MLHPIAAARHLRCIHLGSSNSFDSVLAIRVETEQMDRSIRNRALTRMQKREQDSLRSIRRNALGCGLLAVVLRRDQAVERAMLQGRRISNSE
jgi:hypothetical protein